MTGLKLLNIMPKIDNYKPLSDENEKFLNERGLKLSDIAEMLNMKPQSLRMSTEKTVMLIYCGVFVAHNDVTGMSVEPLRN